MSNCYNCGQSNADFRRTVNTGFSEGTTYGKRITFNRRVYFSKRTICEECAFEQDKANINGAIAIKWIVIIILIFLMYYFKF